MDEIFVDNFAGGGGASTGIELATGEPIAIAVNHDPDAILMHKTNHPHTEHFQASVWDINPKEVCRGRPVALAWFSPDCKHFSKAKGGKPVDKNIRGLAWIALRWAGTVRPRVIILENVEEFQTWGPVRRGRPIKKRQGETFNTFISQLRDLGYEVDWRELVAADYGVPTTRKRFFLIARCDGENIIWPEPTHAPKDSNDVRTGKKLPWVPAASVIDWELPCPSIFDSKEQIKTKYDVSAQRPLRPNTMRRVARGLDKFVLKNTEPYIVQRKSNTVVGANSHVVVAPSLIQYHTEQTGNVRGQALTQPLCTVDAANRYGFMAPYLSKYYSSGLNGQSADTPLHTTTAKDREALAVPILTEVTKLGPDDDLKHWPDVRFLLNEYCGYELGNDEILLMTIGDTKYYISDIGLRMLTPRELYLANGFPPDYVIDHDYRGHKYGKSKQVARCGNAVPPPFATALVRANLPEYCTKNITSMAGLFGSMRMAV